MDGYPHPLLFNNKWAHEIHPIRFYSDIYFRYNNENEIIASVINMTTTIAYIQIAQVFYIVCNYSIYICRYLLVK